MTSLGWTGVDLDGTLAHYVSWDGGKIGAPIPLMVARVKEWLAEGQRVKIMTARVAGDPKGDRGRDIEEQRQRISDWCLEHLGQRLEVTCQKDYGMVRLFDDRCTEVVANTGRLATEYPYSQEAAVAVQQNLHPDEAKPRGETWLHERANWEAEVKRLQGVFERYQKYLESCGKEITRLQEKVLDLCPDRQAHLDWFSGAYRRLDDDVVFQFLEDCNDVEVDYLCKEGREELMGRYWEIQSRKVEEETCSE